MTSYSTPAQDAAFLAAFQAYIPTLQADPNFAAFVAAQQAYVTAVITPPPITSLTDDVGAVWTFGSPTNGAAPTLRNGAAFPDAQYVGIGSQMVLSGGVVYLNAGQWYSSGGGSQLVATATPTVEPSPVTATLVVP